MHDYSPVPFNLSSLCLSKCCFLICIFLFIILPFPSLALSSVLSCIDKVHLFQFSTLFPFLSSYTFLLLITWRPQGKLDLILSAVVWQLFQLLTLRCIECVFLNRRIEKNWENIICISIICLIDWVLIASVTKFLLLQLWNFASILN